MVSDSIEKLRAAVRDVPDFPKPGIVFKDITPILGNGKLFRVAIEAFLEQCRGKQIEKIVGIDARGFLFGSAVAYDLGVGFVPLRKKGRLPYKTESAKYSLEYGEAEMELHVDAIERGEKIILIDDLLATGGTAASAATLIRKVGGVLLEAQFLIELEFLHGRKKLVFEVLTIQLDGRPLCRPKINGTGQSPTSKDDVSHRHTRLRTLSVRQRPPF
jgi:adenine phosphoribosyltransferase